MSKNYEIIYLLRCAVLVVGAENEEQAYEFAENEADFGDCEMVEGSAREITEPTDLESVKRHANATSDDS